LKWSPWITLMCRREKVDMVLSSFGIFYINQQRKDTYLTSPNSVYAHDFHSTPNQIPPLPPALPASHICYDHGLMLWYPPLCPRNATNRTHGSLLHPSPRWLAVVHQAIDSSLTQLMYLVFLYIAEMRRKQIKKLN
jgi:hypothetical protein